MIFHLIQSWDCLLTCLISEGKSVKVSQCNQTSPSLSGFSLFNQLDASQNHKTGKKRMIFCHRLGTLYVLLTGMCLCVFVCVHMHAGYIINKYIYLHIISYTCICLHTCNYIDIDIQIVTYSCISSLCSMLVVFLCYPQH